MLLFVPKRELSVFTRKDSKVRASSAGPSPGDIQDEVEHARGNGGKESGMPLSNISGLGSVASRGVKAENGVAVSAAREGVGGDAVVKRQRTMEEEKEEDEMVKWEEDRIAEEVK